MRHLPFSLAFLPLLACGSNDGPKIDYSKCRGASSMALTNSDLLDSDGSLALRRGLESDLGLEVGDADGNPCDPADVAISFDDASQIEVVSAGENTVLKALRDAADFGTEPVTALHLSLGEARMDLPVHSVLDLGGDWVVTVSEDTLYPGGYKFGKVRFTQRGRTLSWEKPDCTVTQACGVPVTIRGTRLTSDSPDLRLTIDVTPSADRLSFSGSWSTDNHGGAFDGERPPT